MAQEPHWIEIDPRISGTVWELWAAGFSVVAYGRDHVTMSGPAQPELVVSETNRLVELTEFWGEHWIIGATYAYGAGSVLTLRRAP